MEIYLLGFLVIFYLSLRFPFENSKPILILIHTWLFVFIAFRHEVGGDWTSYIDHYLAAKNEFFIDSILTHGEILYSVLNWTSANYFGGIYFANLVCALIFCIGLYLYVSQFDNPFFSLLIAYPYLIVVVSMAYTRQSAALGMLMMGYFFLTHKKFFLGLMVLILGILFHRSLLIVAIFIPFVVKKININYILVLITFGLSIYFLDYLTSISIGLLDNYISNPMISYGAIPRVALNFCAGIIVLMSVEKFILNPEMRIFWMRVSFISILAFIFVFNESISTAIDRTSLYLFPLQIFAFSMYIDKSRQSVILISLFGLIYGIQLVIWLQYGIHAYAWIPYESLLLTPF